MKTNKSLRILSMLLLLLASGSVSYGQAEKRIAELSAKKFQWFADRQYDSLKNFLGPDLMYIHSNGLVENEKELIENLRSGKLVYKDVTVRESKVRVYGNTAVYVGKGSFHVIMDSREGTYELFFTEVYARIDGKWKIVSRHASRLQ